MTEEHDELSCMTHTELAQNTVHVDISQNSKGTFQITCSVDSLSCNMQEIEDQLDDLLKRAKKVVTENGFVLAG